MWNKFSSGVFNSLCTPSDSPVSRGRATPLLKKMWNTYPTVKGPETDHCKSGTEDAAIVATHLMLGAYNAGVDSCWLNCVHIDDLHDALGLPENEEILMLLDLGFATEDAKPLSNHFSRKTLSETVSYL